MAANDTKLLRAEAELVLTEARKQKSERTKLLGSPIELPGKPLDLVIRDGSAWVAENTTIARKIDLETGKTTQIYRGHTAPVTSLAFYCGPSGKNVLITGSWDQTIKVWNTDTKEIISSTHAHSDFVKCLYVFPGTNLLASGSSDKIVRLWDLSQLQKGNDLTSMGSISSHTRPISCFDGRTIDGENLTLYTADTMGIIKAWSLTFDEDNLRWNAWQVVELSYHRTGVNELFFRSGQLWTASSDESAQVLTISESVDATVQKPASITHPAAVRTVLPLEMTEVAEPYLITGAGDTIRVYDVNTPEVPDLIHTVDAHWHDVTSLRLWMRKITAVDGKLRTEPWIISASLDGTLRKWRLQDILKPGVTEVKVAPPPEKDAFEMSEEEEREFAELMSD